MPLSHLKISQFRNLGSVDIKPSRTLNFLYGSNGSGKTSVLEAVSVLAHGRSFRTRKFKRLVQEETERFVVFGRLEDAGLPLTTVGIERPVRGNSQFRLNSQAVTSSAELAASLPLLVLNADSFGLLTGPPKQRRQFFDWLVFHVKPDFRDLWKQYSRCVKQRNSLLRRDKIAYSDVRPWDLEIAKLSTAIERDRLACVDPLLEEFRVLAPELRLGGTHVDDLLIEYLSGWKNSEPYLEQLGESFSRDRRVGYTSLGPHKSDLKITLRGTSAGEILSRGQQKSTIAALFIAEALVFFQAKQRGCVFLIDDMPSELDLENISRVGRWINSINAQVFVTSVEFEPLKQAWPNLENETPKVFHVEHGTVHEVSATPVSR